MTATGSRASRGTRRADSACISRYSTGVRTSISSTVCPRRRNSSSSSGLIVATLISLPSCAPAPREGFPVSLPVLAVGVTGVTADGWRLEPSLRQPRARLVRPEGTSGRRSPVGLYPVDVIVGGSWEAASVVPFLLHGRLELAHQFLDR